MSKARLQIAGHDGAFELAIGETLLEAATAQGFDLDHACGGVCACSTCHVVIDQGGDCFSEATDDELDQLDQAPGASLESRLGCQARLQRLPDDATIAISIPSWNRNAVQEGS